MPINYEMTSSEIPERTYIDLGTDELERHANADPPNVNETRNFTSEMVEELGDMGIKAASSFSTEPWGNLLG